jgi:hypothetical protein
MIIVSSGFPKSASTLLFLYTEEILKQSGKRSAQNKFRKHYPEGFIHRFGILNTAYLCWLNLFFGNVVVKTHSGPNFFLRVLIKLGIAKAYYSIRDPRDVILSALDHGKKARMNGIKSPADNAFLIYEKKEDLFESLKMHYANYTGWKKFDKLLFVRYENLLASPEAELKKVLAMLKWNEKEELIQGIIELFSKKKSETKNFNKGELSRFEKEFSEEELKETENAIREIIPGMGYQLTIKK